MKKICIVFPGRKYSCDRSLLYFSANEIRKKGYQMKYFRYNDNPEDDEKESFEDFSLRAKKYVDEQIKTINFDEYDKIIFLSKSIGTIFASELTKQIGEKKVHNIFITPLNETIKNIKANDLTLCGDKDRFFPNAKKELAKFPYAYVFPFSSHSLEDLNNINQTIKKLGEIVSIVKVYLENIDA